MLSRTRVALLAGLVLLGAPVRHATAAEGFLGRTTGVVGDFFRGLVDLLTPDGDGDDELERALETYARGHYFTTWLHASRLENDGRDWLRDEASLLAGLAAADAGIREEAVPRLKAVLEADPVSPYYPVALAALLELEAELGNHDAAADAAATYLGDFWRRPRSPRDADVKAIFLETGNVVEDRGSDKGDRPGAFDRKIERRADRPTDRALYLAGLALLRERRFEPAAGCFESLTEESPYYAYARYGLAQASYGLARHRAARAALNDIVTHAGEVAGEVYLRDRASLLSAQILHEIDEDSAAIRWLSGVSSEGPFAMHAALLAAEIQAEREDPALALVYLRDRPTEGVEPKLVAHAAVLDAELHRELRDTATAVARLEEGIRELDRYRDALRAASDGEAPLERLLRPLEVRTRSRRHLESWRRRNVSNAVPALVHGTNGAGWGSRTLASLFGGGDAENGYPVVYHRRSYDPFSTVPPPAEPRFEPPGDRAFPSLFRRSFGNALGEALRHEIELRAALEEDDPVQLALLVVDGEIRLREGAAERSDAGVVESVHALGLPAAVADMVRENRSRSQVLLHAAKELAADAPPLDAARSAARSHLERWEARQRALVREAVTAEEKQVEELRARLELELTETLVTRDRGGDRILGVAPGSSRESDLPAG